MGRMPSGFHMLWVAAAFLHIGPEPSARAQTGSPAPFLGETLEEFKARTGKQAESGAQHDVRPFLGETSRDFEIRRRGGVVQAAPAIVTVAADPNGHFFVDCVLNGQTMRMVVDTGATMVSLSPEDAELAGIHVSDGDFVRKLSTANGEVRAAPVRISEIRVGDILVHDIEAVVLPHGNRTLGLLGMSFLKQLKGFEVSQGQMTLRG